MGQAKGRHWWRGPTWSRFSAGYVPDLLLPSVCFPLTVCLEILQQTFGPITRPLASKEALEMAYFLTEWSYFFLNFSQGERNSQVCWLDIYLSGGDSEKQWSKECNTYKSCIEKVVKEDSNGVLHKLRGETVEEKFFKYVLHFNLTCIPSISHMF